MPRLVLVAGVRLAALRVADDEAVLGAVLGEPLALGGFAEVELKGVDVVAETGVVLGVARTRRVGVGGLLAVPGDVVVVQGLLEIVGIGYTGVS